MTPSKSSLALFLVPAILSGLPLGAQSSVTTRLSVDAAGAQANSAAIEPSVSSTGRYVAFSSTATNLVPGDTNGVSDVFVKDRATGAIERVSVNSAGVQGNGNSNQPGVSSDGRFVVFHSTAANLVPGDTNALFDVFLRDRLLGTTARVSVSSTGVQSNGIAVLPRISADGSTISFASNASNLVAGDTNGTTDIFVHERVSGVTSRVSLTAGGGQTTADQVAAPLSYDGRYVAFQSQSTGLVPGVATGGFPNVYVRDRIGPTTRIASINDAGLAGNQGSIDPSISADGSRVSFTSGANNLVAGDTNNTNDVFVRDLSALTTVRVSVSSLGAQANAQSARTAISGDGLHVAFETQATNLFPGDGSAANDVARHDLATATTVRVSVSTTGGDPNAGCNVAAVPYDGRDVVFVGSASNLVPNDTNFAADVFVVDVDGCTEPEIYCTAKLSSHGCLPSVDYIGQPYLSAPADFEMRCSALEPGLVGLGLLNLSGPAAVPALGGTLCLASPFQRLPGAPTGGAATCSGTLAYGFDDLLAAPGVVIPAGSTVGIQFWARDVGDLVFGSGLSNALSFVACP